MDRMGADSESRVWRTAQVYHGSESFGRISNGGARGVSHGWGRREKLGAVWQGREDPSGRLNDARGCQTAHAQTTRGQTVEFLGRDNSSRGDGISRCRRARENAPCCTAAAGAVAVKSIVKQTTNRMGSGEQLMEHWRLFRHGRCEGEAPKIEGTSAGPPARAETPISARAAVRSFRPHPPNPTPARLHQPGSAKHCQHSTWPICECKIREQSHLGGGLLALLITRFAPMSSSFVSIAAPRICQSSLSSARYRARAASTGTHTP